MASIVPFRNTILLIFSHAAQPVLFKTQLQNLERQAGESASLCCETTKPGASVVWRHGDKVLSSSSKYRLRQDGSTVELVVYKLQGPDAGVYSCDTGSQRTSAVLTVQGRSENRPFMHNLESFLISVLEHGLHQPFMQRSRVPSTSLHLNTLSHISLLHYF